MKKIINENPFSTLQDIKTGCDLTQSIASIHRYTKKIGADLKEAKKVIILSEQNKLKRLAFAKKMIVKSDAYFKRIMWTDETKVQGFPNGEKVKGRSIKTSPLKTPLKSNGGGGVMFWGAVSWYAYGPLVVVEGTIDSSKYLELLKDVVVPEMAASPVPLIFQQDNASSHSAAIIKSYFATWGYETIEWPPQSPDLSSIEWIWNIMKMKMKALKPRPRTPAKMRAACQKIWLELGEEPRKKSIETFRERLEWVIKNKGDKIPFYFLFLGGEKW